MNSRLRIGIIVSVIGLALIVLGTVAVIRLYQQASQEPEVEAVDLDIIFEEVVVASHDIPLGKLLTNADLNIVSIPVEFATRNSISTIEDAVGKILKVDLISGELILSHNLADPTAITHDVAYILSETHVLYAFPAVDLMSREALIQRGDLIDVFATLDTAIEVATEEDPEEKTEVASITFNAMQRLNITAMIVDIITEEATIQAEGDEAETVPRQRKIVKAYLLALDPQDALVLKHLKDIGANFDFVLRAPTSTGSFDLTPVTSEYLKEFYGLEILP